MFSSNFSSCVLARHTGDVMFFENKCKLPIGISEDLADLAREITDKVEKDSKPTAEQVKEWDANKLLNWIKEHRSRLLKVDQLKKFEEADIDGATFLKHAGDKKFFHEECKLPIGTSEMLTDLAIEIVGLVQKGKSTEHAPLLFSLH